MTEIIVVICLLLVAAIAFLMAMLNASYAARDDFDGGFRHDNTTRITKVRGRYIINDGE